MSDEALLALQSPERTSPAPLRRERRDAPGGEGSSAAAGPAVVDGVAVARSGAEIPMRADCVCIHSDTPGAAELARVLNEALAAIPTERSPWHDTRS